MAKLKRRWDEFRFGLVSQHVWVVPVESSYVRLVAAGPRTERVVWLVHPYKLRC